MFKNFAFKNFIAAACLMGTLNIVKAEEKALPAIPELFKKINCDEVDERKLRDFFPVQAGDDQFNSKSDGYLPWEAVDKKIWISREREVAVQINLKRDKKNFELEIILKNTCRPDLYFATASFKLPSQSLSKAQSGEKQAKGDFGVKDVEFSPLRIVGTILLDKYQGSEILGFLKYQPLIKSPNEDVAEKLSLSFYVYLADQKRYQLIDLFQVFPLKELER